MPVEVVIGNIVECDAEVIVNAANAFLLGGGGVDGAIHDAAGPGLLSECRTLGGCETGQIRVTGAHDLPFKAIIHAVGPVWRGGGHDEETLLRACYENALRAADELGAESIAFPAISTGAFEFPEKLAAEIATQTCVRWSRMTPMRILLVAFDGGHAEVLSLALEGATVDR